MQRAQKPILFGTFLAALVMFAGCGIARGDDGFYVVAVGRKAKRTLLVSPQGTPTESGIALLSAVAGITDATESNPYLIVIEPGIYDLGGSSLQMKQYVDIQGSGENVTKLRSNVDGALSGVINGANNAELRFLSVENTGGGYFAKAISNYKSSPTLTHITVEASGGSFNFGVSNVSSAPKMTNVKVSAMGGGYSYGVANYFSSFPSLASSTIEASGATYNYGVYNASESIIKIDNCRILGADNSICNFSGCEAYVTGTRLEGGAVGCSGAKTCKCAGVYDEGYNFFTDSCP